MTFHDVSGLIISLAAIAIFVAAVVGAGYGILSLVRDLRDLRTGGH